MEVTSRTAKGVLGRWWQARCTLRNYASERPACASTRRVRFGNAPPELALQIVDGVIALVAEKGVAKPAVQEALLAASGRPDPVGQLQLGDALRR